MEEIKNNKLDDFERQPVPEDLRKGWISLSMVWIAIGIDISSMLLGAQLGAGLSFSKALLSVLIGSTILGILSAICAYVGVSTGLSTAMITRFAFGNYGAKLVSAIIGISLLGWFGVQAGFFAQNAQTALQQALGFHLETSTLAVIGGIIMMTTAIIGYRSIEKLSVWSVPLMLLLIGIAIYQTLNHQPLSQIVKMNVTGQPLGFGLAISLVIGIFIVGTVISPDVARWARSRRDAVLAAFFGFFIGNSFMLIVAIILSKATGTSDLTKIFMLIGLGIPAIIVITLAQWTTNTNNLYSSSLGFSVVFPKISKPLLTFILGIFAILLAYLGIYDNFITFLSWITMLICPVGGIYLAEFFFLNRKGFTFVQNDNVPAIMIRSLVAWAIASGTVLLTTPAPDGLGLLQLTTIPALDGFLIGGILQLILGKLFTIKTQSARERGI